MRMRRPMLHSSRAVFTESEIALKYCMPFSKHEKLFFHSSCSARHTLLRTGGRERCTSQTCFWTKHCLFFKGVFALLAWFSGFFWSGPEKKNILLVLVCLAFVQSFLRPNAENTKQLKRFYDVHFATKQCCVLC